MARLSLVLWTLQIGTVCLLLQEVVGQTKPPKKAYRLIIMDYEKVGTATGQPSAPLRVQTTTKRTSILQSAAAVETRSGVSASSYSFSAGGMVMQEIDNTSLPQYATIGYDNDIVTLLPTIIPFTNASITQVAIGNPVQGSTIDYSLLLDDTKTGAAPDNNDDEVTLTTQPSARSSTKRSVRQRTSTSTTTTTTTTKSPKRKTKAEKKTKKPKRDRGFRKMDADETTTSAAPNTSTRAQKIKKIHKTDKQSTASTTATTASKKASKEKRRE